MELKGPRGRSGYSTAEYKNLDLPMGARGAVSMGLKRLGLEADNSPTYTAEVNNQRA